MKFATGFLYYCGILFERRTGMKKLIAAAVLSLSAVISGSAAAEWSVEEAVIEALSDSFEFLRSEHKNPLVLFAGHNIGKVQAKADEAGRKIETEKSRQEALDAEAKAKREAKAAEAKAKLDAQKEKIQKKLDAKNAEAAQKQAAEEAKRAEQRKSIENAKNSLDDLKKSLGGE